jgi:hypothetical protein
MRVANAQRAAVASRLEEEIQRTAPIFKEELYHEIRKKAR